MIAVAIMIIKLSFRQKGLSVPSSVHEFVFISDQFRGFHRSKHGSATKLMIIYSTTVCSGTLHGGTLEYE